MNEIIPFDGGLQVNLRRGIFDNKRVITRVVEFNYQSIQDIANQILPAGLPCACSIGGEVIPQDQWATTFVAVNDSIIFTPCMQSGDTNWGKAIIGAILVIVAIVLIIFAPYGSGIWAQLAYAGIAMIFGIGASLLISAFMPIPDIPAQEEGPDSKNSITQWAPRTTQVQGGVLPRYYGTHKVSGNIIAANIENVGDKQYLLALICIGLGPYKGIRNIIINKIKMENIRDVRIATTLGYLNQPSLPGFEDTIVNYADSQKMLYNIPVIRQTIVDSFDELIIKMLFPSGLGYVSDNGSIVPIGVKLQVKVKGPLDPDWIVIPESRTPYQVQVVTAGVWVYGYNMYGQGFVATGGNGETDPKAHSEGDVAGYITDWEWGYNTEVYWHFNVISGYMATQYYDYIIIDKPIGRNRVPIELKFKIPEGRKGIYDICITRLTTDFEETRYLDDVYYVGYATIVYDDFTYPRHALIAAKALNTDQLNGNFDFSCILDGAYVRVYDENTQQWSIEWSDNHAWVAYDILTSPLFNDELTEVLRYDGENPSRMDLDSFVAFANFCNTLQPEEKTQSVVSGTDGLKYKCIQTHVSTLPTKPVTGIHINILPAMSAATDPVTGGVVATSTPINATYPPWDCMNNKPIGAHWRGTEIDMAKEVWISFTFTTTKCINEYSIRWYPGLYAKDWVFEGYTGSAWNVLHTVTGFTPPYQQYPDVNNASDNIYTISNYVSHSAYRIRFTRRLSKDIGIMKLQMKETGDEWNDYWELTGDGTPETWTLGQKYYCGFEKRYTFNGGFDTRTSRWQAALNVCASAQATLIKIGTKTKVLIDQIRTPKQLFSEGNMISWTEKFLNLTDRATEIEVDFTNKDNDYEKDKISVFHSNAPAVYGKFNLPVFGLVKKTEVWRLAKHHVVQNQRRHAMEITVDIESIISMVGDAVYVQSEMCDWAEGERGGNIIEGTSTTVVIDKTFTADVAKTYSIAIRLSNDEIVFKELAPMDGDYTTLTIKSGTWGTIDPVFGDPYVVGELSKMVKIFAITSVTPNETHGATISMIEYDETWYSQINDAVPEIGPWLPGQDPSQLYVVITEVYVAEESYVDSSGVMIRTLKVAWVPSTTAKLYSKGKVYYRDYNPLTGTAGAWQSLQPTTECNNVIVGVLANTAYEVRVTGFDSLGSETPFDSEYAHSAYITSGGIPTGIIDPPLISGIEVFGGKNSTTFTGRDCHFIWNGLQSLANTPAGGEISGAGQNIVEFEWIYEVIIKTIAGAELRKIFLQEPEYIYSFEKNNDDTSSSPTPTFSIEVRGIDQWGRVSPSYTKLNVSNSVPETVSGLTAAGVVGGVRFSWDIPTDTDIVSYSYRTAIGAGSYGEWKEVQDNVVSRMMTPAEITANGPNPEIYIQIKAKDCYNQTSVTAASANTKANDVSDNIFQLSSSASGGTGIVSSLYDGVLNSGGVNIA